VIQQSSGTANPTGIRMRRFVSDDGFFGFPNHSADATCRRMKILLLLTTLALTSCNTSIGLYRDTKQAFHWTKDKIQGTGGDGYGNY